MKLVFVNIMHELFQLDSTATISQPPVPLAVLNGVTPEAIETALVDELGKDLEKDHGAPVGVPTPLQSGDQLRLATVAVERRLKDILGKYNKRNIDCEQFSPDTAKIAVARAEKLDESPNDRWPQKTGSHVYRVVKQLLPA